MNRYSNPQPVKIGKGAAIHALSPIPSATMCGRGGWSSAPIHRVFDRQINCVRCLKAVA